MSSDLSISTAGKAGARSSSSESNAGKAGDGKVREAGKIGALLVFREAWLERGGGGKLWR
jgi:hypothetical protein